MALMMWLAPVFTNEYAFAAFGTGIGWAGPCRGIAMSRNRIK
jgi:hypothetical protein